MVKKLLPNRNSKVIAADAWARIEQAVLVIQQALGEIIAISEEEYKGLRKISDKLKQESDDVFAIAKANPELLDSPLSVKEIEKDKVFYELCDKLQALLNPILLQLVREQNIAGAEYLNACSFFETMVALKAAQGNPKAQHVHLLLSKVSRNKNRTPAKPSDKS
jgi:hypothetical protein